jgi:peroxiredoxin
MKALALAAAALLALSQAALAQEGPKRPTPPSPRPQYSPTRTAGASLRISGQVYVGEQAPDFELDASNGKPLKLSRLRGDWVVLAFAERREQLGKLRSAYPEIHELGAQIIGVCDEKAHALKTYAERDSVPFLLLADVTSEISSLYGLFDSERGTTRPGFLVIDRRGIVRMALLGQQLPAEEIARLARFAITGL